MQTSLPPTPPMGREAPAGPLPDPSHRDSTLDLLADPYRFIGSRCQALGRDLFETRLLLQRTVCMSGPAAAALFYDGRNFTRERAAPRALRATLFGRGGVQGLDAAEHRHRKAMLLQVLTPERVRALAAYSALGWQQWARLQALSPGRTVPLYDVAQRVLARAVCDWAGVTVEDTELPRRTTDLAALFDRAAGPLRSHLQARRARRRCEAWLAAQVRALRQDGQRSTLLNPLQAIAQHRDLHGDLLDARIAAVELLNVLRPTVAVSVYVVLVAHALHVHPHWRARLRAGSPQDLEDFVQEVRRFYPFFPAVVARARQDFAWQGQHFRAGQRVLLDLYGTNHDPRCWTAPDEFRPERFREGAIAPFGFVPQGGGDLRTGHRCPGEAVAVALMKVATNFLVKELDYGVPPQDLGIDMARLPALPRDRFRITVRAS